MKTSNRYIPPAAREKVKKTPGYKELFPELDKSSTPTKSNSNEVSNEWAKVAKSAPDVIAIVKKVPSPVKQKITPSNDSNDSNDDESYSDCEQYDQRDYWDDDCAEYDEKDMHCNECGSDDEINDV